MFIINYDHLEHKAVKGVGSIDYDGRELRYAFQLYDDDGILYFEGRSSSDSSFDPLDDYGVAFGCTEIRYLHDGVWKQL